ncbi:hypothetical protein [Chroococcus sp. FPU101]|uniref:hypothetical protein n=1 Tax=Chroococcus sp. FPU101 TaxID=1974212 RepID=UPI001A8D48E3|nr:hypothetical protein [Chroococcus sp. FPU101]
MFLIDLKPLKRKMFQHHESTINRSNNFCSAINPRTGCIIYADSETELRMMLKELSSPFKNNRTSAWF